MSNLFTYNPFFAYGFLLIVTILLRIPSFHPEFYNTDESLYLVCAEVITDGGQLYEDVWDHKPPVLIWFYTLFQGIFGSWALGAIKVFTILYLFVSALFFNQMIYDLRLVERFSILPGLLLVLICSVPWYAQEMNAEMLMLLPVMLSVYQFILIGDDVSENSRRLNLAGILLGICFMIKYQAAFLALGLFLSYLINYPPRLKTAFSFLAGALTSVLVILAILYLRGNLPEFWDIGVLYNLDYIFNDLTNSHTGSLWERMLNYIRLYGVLVILAIISIVHFRVNFFTLSIRHRKTDTVFFIWFIFSLLTLFLGGSRLYTHYFIMLAPPVAYYASIFFEFRMKPWLKSASVIAAILFPLLTFAHYFVVAYPSTFSFVYPWVNQDDNGWVVSWRNTLNQRHEVMTMVDADQAGAGVFLLAFEPELYLRMNAMPVNKYNHANIIANKFTILNPDADELFSRSIPPGEIYANFRFNLPEYVIEEKSNRRFHIFQREFPVLFGGYKADSTDRYVIFKRND